MFFIYVGTDVLLRNPRKTEHRLVALIATCYALLFAEEYVRHQLPLGSSPELVALWFSNAGIAIPGLGFHFLAKISGMDRRMPRFVYPYIFHLPLLTVIANVSSRTEVISSSEFNRIGLWNMPVYNVPYYAALTVSIAISLLYLVVLHSGRKHATGPEHRAIFRLLIFGVFVSTVWHVVFGYFQFGSWTPPYPYIYGGIVWLFLLRLAMIRYDFLDYATVRYERMFNMNPAAILLIDRAGAIKEANPVARQLFELGTSKRKILFDMVEEGLENAVTRGQTIKDFETAVYSGGKRVHVLIDGDFLTIDSERHVILIVRDITMQKESQEEILFLAYHDPLTRLPNRRLFYERLDEAIREAEADKLRLTVMLIDLDFFKAVNDKYGHEAGDALLKHVAKVIDEIARPFGLAARLGGDEFVLFIRHAPSRAFVEGMIGQLRRRLTEEKLRYGDVWLPVEMSIGASLYPEDGTDCDTLLMNADNAMYEVKRSGRNAFRMGKLESGSKGRS